MIKFIAVEDRVINFLFDAHAKFTELNALISSPEIIAHNSYYLKLVEERNLLEDTANLYLKLAVLKKELKEYEFDLENTLDNEYKSMILKEIPVLKGQIDLIIKQARLEMLKAIEQKQEKSDGAYVQIFFDGGESEFSRDLYKMYNNYAQDLGLLFKDEEKTDKYIAFSIDGNFAYFKLKGENGVHKSDKGTLKVLVLPKFTPCNVSMDEKDVRIDLFHSGGAGGQNVNKVQTAVRATHLPSGIAVVCQDNRSQLQNKNDALCLLKKRVEEFKNKQNNAKYDKIKKDQIRLSGKDKVRIYNYAGQTATGKNGETRPIKKVFEGDL